MANKSLSQQRLAAGIIKNETLDKANTAQRVGEWMLNESDSSVKEYDPSAAYQAGQSAIFEGSLAKCIQNTQPGESPTTHKLKWSRKLITDQAGIAEGNYNPVSGHALAQRLGQSNSEEDGTTLPNAGEGVAGIVPIATNEEVNEGVRDDVAISPLKNKNYFTKFFQDFVAAVADLTGVLKKGNIGEGQIVLKPTDTGTQPGYFLSKLVGGILTKIAGFELHDDNTASITFLGKRVINMDANTLRLDAVATLVSNFLKAKKLGLTEQEEVTTTEFLGAPVYDDPTASWIQKKISVANMGKLLNSLINETTDLLVRRLRIVQSESALEGIAYQKVVRQQVGANWIDRVITRQQDAADMWANLSDLDLRNRLVQIFPNLGTVTIDEGDLRQVLGIKCRPKPATTYAIQTLELDHVAPGTPVMHGLDTPGNNIGVQSAYVYDSAASRFRRDDALDQFIEFPDSSHVVINAGASGYASAKIRLVLERLVLN